MPNEKKIPRIVVSKLVPDEVMTDMEGEFINLNFNKLDSNTFPMLAETDIDIYKENGEILLKFRKNVISKDLCDLAFKNYKSIQMSRGAASRAGPINEDSKYWKKRRLVRGKEDKKNSKWMTKYITPEGSVSKMTVSNPVFTHVVGYYEATPFLNLPCRLTSWTRRNFKKYEAGLPFVEKMNELFKKLAPNKHKIQKKRADLKPNFRIKNTAFSTLTLNRNFRTALHLDAGDYKQGIGCLSVVERGHYHGGYTIFPQYGVAVDIRSGDFIVADIGGEWHCNTPIYETQDDIRKNKKLKADYNMKSDRGVEGENKKYSRITFVCYLRHNLANCS